MDNCSSDNSRNESLVDAAAEGNLEMLNEALSNGANPNYRSPRDLKSGSTISVIGKGNSALHVACYKSFRSIIHRLIELGANLNIKSNQNGSTPLHYSSYNGDSDVVELLIENGSSLHEKTTGWNRTPLHSACFSGKAKVVEVLLDRGSLSNEQDLWGRTPLHYASDFGHEDAASILVNRGADLHVMDKNGVTPLHLASQRGRCNVVSLLLASGASHDKKFDGGVDTPLRMAELYNEFAVIEILNKWTLTMAIIIMKELSVFTFIDLASLVDISEFLGE